MKNELVFDIAQVVGLDAVLIAFDATDIKIIRSAIGVVAVLRVAVATAILLASVEVIIRDRRIIALRLTVEDSVVHGAAC